MHCQHSCQMPASIKVSVSNDHPKPPIQHRAYHINLILAHKEWLIARALGSLDLQMVLSAGGPFSDQVHSSALKKCPHMTVIIGIRKVGEIPLPFCEARMSILHT